MALIDQIYDAATDDAAYARLPEVLAGATGARSAVMLELGGDLMPVACLTYRYPQQMTDRYIAERLAPFDVWTSLVADIGSWNQVTLAEDYIDADAFRRTTMYNELFRYFGDDTARCMGTVLRLSQGYLTLGLHRGFGQRRFEAREAATIAELLPHLTRLGEIRLRLGQADARTRLLGHVVDDIACGLIVTDASGRILLANAAAESLLRAGDTLCQQQGRLASRDDAMTEQLIAAVRSASEGRGARGGIVRLAAGPASTSLRMIVAPMSGPTPAAMILIEDPADRSDRLIGQLVSIFGFTPTEALIARQLLRGRALGEIAAERGVSLETVRSQVKSIYGKANVRSQIELITLMPSTLRAG
jgi:DNA-binding CsgD family transcriptional regulator/PAS domain-containing protein